MAKQQQKAGAEFAFRAGARVSGVEADAAAAELERIRRERGALTPEFVVAEARDEDNPVHAHFEWDDGLAGHQYRLLQARQLIRAVVVLVDDRPAEHVYVHVRTEDGGSYQPTEVVVRNPDLLAAALEELTEKLAMAQQSVGELRRIAAGARDRARVRQAGKVGRHIDAAIKAAKGAD